MRFGPGESGVRLSYKLPYPGNRLSLRNVVPYATGRFIVAAPPSVQISGEGLSSAGQDQGFSVYMRDTVAANTAVNIAVSGTAPMQAAAQGGTPPQSGQSLSSPPSDASQTPSVNSRLEASGAEAPATTATSLPARLDSLKWILVGGFVAHLRARLRVSLAQTADCRHRILKWCGHRYDLHARHATGAKRSRRSSR